MKPYLFLLCGMLITSPGPAQSRYDIVITEIMADPSPPTGLPNVEWIELKNTTASPINLSAWRMADLSGQSGPFPDFILQPDSSVIIGGAAAVSALGTFGNAIALTSFPSLANEGELIYLKSSTGMTMHAVNYSSTWYDNELKQDGGWSLEMIDPRNPCQGRENWKASRDLKGGTPGQTNSINGTNRDATPIHLKNVYPLHRSSLIITFDEPADSIRATVAGNYRIDGGLSIVQANVLAPYFDQVQLILNDSLQDNTIYTVSIFGVTDCSGNEITLSTFQTGWPSESMAGDIVINEILADPLPGGEDYVEIHNKSHHILDAASLYLANRAMNAVASITKLSTQPFLIFPGAYVVITENAGTLAHHYFVKNPEAVLIVPSLPSFPDKEGSIIVLNARGDIMDEVSYTNDWHFPLLSTTEGVSLERIDPAGSSQDKSNWHSAVATAGFGTPGYQNSHYKNQQGITGVLQIEPPVFSPDNDGWNDIMTLHYRLQEPGFVANVMVFDAVGRPVKVLVRNETISTTGYWNWNGLDDKGSALSPGSYIIVAELFNLAGKKQTFKKTVVLAKKII